MPPPAAHPGSLSSEGCSSAGAPRAAGRTCCQGPRRRPRCGVCPRSFVCVGAVRGSFRQRTRPRAADTARAALPFAFPAASGVGPGWRAGDAEGEEPASPGRRGPAGPAPVPPPAAGARAAAGRAGACEPASQRAAAAASPACGDPRRSRGPRPPGAGMHHGHAGLPGAVLGRYGPFQQHQLPRAQPAAAVHVPRGPRARHPAGRGPPTAAGAAQGTAGREAGGRGRAGPLGRSPCCGTRRGRGAAGELSWVRPGEQRPRADLPSPR